MPRPLKVIQLLPQLNAGGVERGTLEISRALVAAGHDSIVISGGGRLVQTLESEGARHLQVQVFKKSPSTLLSIPTLRRIFQAERPDIVHARSRVPAWATALAWKTLPKKSRPVFVTTAHGMNRVSRYSQVMVNSEHVIAVSETTKQYLLNGYPGLDEGNVTVIHRGVSEDEFPYGYQPSTEWRQQWYADYPSLKDQFVVCVSGRLTRLKGHFDLLDAVVKLQDRGVVVHVVIAGSADPRRASYVNELTDKVESLGLGDQVVFTGHRSDIRDVISTCDVVVSTTYQPPESFGRAVLESLRLGKVTLGYDHGGVGEVLGHAYPEGRIPLRDTDALADRIAAAMQGKLSVPKNTLPFPLAEMQDKTLQLYQRLVADRKRAASEG